MRYSSGLLVAYWQKTVANGSLPKWPRRGVMVHRLRRFFSDDSFCVNGASPRVGSLAREGDCSLRLATAASKTLRRSTPSGSRLGGIVKVRIAGRDMGR